MTKKEKLLLSLAGALVDHPRAGLETLADMVGTSRRTLYRMARSRDELILLLDELISLVVVKVMDESNLESGEVREVFKRLTKGFLAYPDLAIFSCVDPYVRSESDKRSAASEVVTEHQARMEAFFLRGQRDGFFRIDVPADWLVQSYDYLLRAASAGLRSGTIAAAHAPSLVSAIFLDGAGVRRRALLRTDSSEHAAARGIRLPRRGKTVRAQRSLAPR